MSRSWSKKGRERVGGSPLFESGKMVGVSLRDIFSRIPDPRDASGGRWSDSEAAAALAALDRAASLKAAKK